MVRKCKCAGGCCGSQSSDIDRRGFLTILGGSAAAAGMSGPAWAEWVQNKVSPEQLERWKKSLTQNSPPTVYRSDIHTDARMHLGGIGTGNIEIGADGRFTHWQLFNTLKDGEVPFWFAVRAGGVSKLLQTTAGSKTPRVKQIEMTGEYPIATLKFDDAELPVKLELTAFTPFAPLDTRFSSQPLSAMTFHIHNPTATAQTVSLASVMQNPVGYDAVEPLAGRGAECLAGNVNEPFRDGKAVGLLMRAEPGKEPTMDKPVKLYFGMKLDALRGSPQERPKEFEFEVIPDDGFHWINPKNPTRSIIWFEEPSDTITTKSLTAMKTAVEWGAVLVLSGKTSPLLARFAKSWKSPRAPADKRPDIVFADFEQGYDKWTVEGRAFGHQPATGALPGQWPVAGFRGKGLVNSFNGGDLPVGRLVSKPFTVDRDFIHFLVGGGNKLGAQVRLVVGGKTVRTATGRDSEELAATYWNVRQYAGREAHFEIVDEEKGGWGHILVDHIVFSDQAEEDLVVPLLTELLPINFSGARAVANQDRVGPNSMAFDNLELRPGASQSTLGNGLTVYSRPLGKGKVVVASGAILDPSNIGSPKAKQQAYTDLCKLRGIRYTLPEGVPPSACGFGTVALAALAGDVTVLPGVSSESEAWDAFQATGRFMPVNDAKATVPAAPTHPVFGGVAATVEVPAGGIVEVPFLLAWHFPNKYSPPAKDNYGVPPQWIGCHYATLWPNAKTVIRDAAKDLPTLWQRTNSFRTTFYDSTLPYWFLDCITSQAATIRHIGVVFRIANGDVYGWEGSNGCCNPTCNHVWGYEQTLSRLFPDLEKIMRQIDYKRQQFPDGCINNRTAFPSPPKPVELNPATDGQASCILKAYREALNHPDDSFLKEYWPNVKKAVEYLIARDAGKGEADGVLEDDQWNTYDQALHGATTFISGYYLAALRAGEEWAKRMGDSATAERFHSIFLKGQENLVRRCWNGEYFQQDLPDYQQRGEPSLGGAPTSGEVGPGCMADQLIGQWWAHQLGLGYILPRDKVRTALKSVFRYNWVPDLTGFKQAPRVFCADGTKGLLTVTWPKGGRPKHVMLYSDEVWTGLEYQVAAHLIYEGMIEEGLSIARGARERYDGISRKPIECNPWNEMECGGHYARAMSSYSLLLALSGWEYDGLAKSLRFAPRITPEKFQSFFAGPEGWGSIKQVRDGKTQRNEIHVVEGRLPVAELRLAAWTGVKQFKATLAGATLEATLRPATDGELAIITLATPAIVKAGETLTVELF
ncbi:MAG: non-lysosomal glucosylceramidase [Planctomycetaceae bacterium]|nr:non-lysosomal glucosylceramidase [Planctomycetaceae bacterium]